MLPKQVEKKLEMRWKLELYEVCSRSGLLNVGGTFF